MYSETEPLFKRGMKTLARLRSFRGDFFTGTLVILDIGEPAADDSIYYSGVLLSDTEEPVFEWIHENDPRMQDGRESHMYVSPYLKPFGGRVGLGTKLREILDNEPLPDPPKATQ
ncbi:hypothetical protein [Alkalicoccus daliensis]|uniref:hypothetical protein n=1 Tax=Alkalicoccus daliensis TaxID=745820 RepID=UPI000B8789FA|nr:hypothetical protein [Alkalicoccus daliensis]